MRNRVYKANRNAPSDNGKIRVIRKGSKIYKELKGIYNLDQEVYVYYGSSDTVYGAIAPLNQVMKDSKWLEKEVDKRDIVKVSKRFTKQEALRSYMRNDDIANIETIFGNVGKKRAELAVNNVVRGEIVKSELRDEFVKDPNASWEGILDIYGEDEVHARKLTKYKWSRMSRKARKEWLAANMFGINKKREIYYYGDSI